VIRLSGPDARGIVAACCRVQGKPLQLSARGGCDARLFDGTGEQPALVLWMPGPASYTGEDVAELHLCAAPELLRAALQHCLALGAVLAQPGEFTRRAFENARIDLARAEGVLALVCARNEEQRRAASALLLGGLSTRTDALREQLVELRALCEASLDFDEQDTGGIPTDQLAARARELLRHVDEALAWETARESPSGLPRAVLVGAPNAGKSSLFNRLAGGAALVSEMEGTTRDALRATWTLADAAVELWDSAGAANAADGAEPDRLAQQRSSELRSSADLWLWVVDAARPPISWHAAWSELSPIDGPPPTLLLLNKADALSPALLEEVERSLPDDLVRHLQGCVAVSASSGEGLDTAARLAEKLLAGESAAGEIRALAARHLRALADARVGVLAALGLLGGAATLDLAAHELRAATDELDQIRGRTLPEDLLDRIFARFCLGK
jgi:tRNA modification GTPase